MSVLLIGVVNSLGPTIVAMRELLAYVNRRATFRPEEADAVKADVDALNARLDAAFEALQASYRKAKAGTKAADDRRAD